MSSWLEVTDGGLAVTVQDLGRTGYRQLGVPLSGALDPCLMAAANALLGNDPGAAVLEVRLAGPSLKALSGPVRVSLAGDIDAQVLDSRGRTRRVESWQTATLFPGDAIRVGAAAGGAAYVGITGGIQVPLALGSRSTYLRAGIGGVAGRALAAGDRLPCGPVSGDPWRESWGRAPWPREEGPIRVIPGPQDDHFPPPALEAFFGRPWRVSRELDRMGIRLDGDPLAHIAGGAEIVSDGVAPGAIQVPANGRPIVLLVDCQTTGGYPKIATVIRADLPRLAHLRPGGEVRFAAVDHAEALAALARQGDNFQRWAAAIAPFLPPGVVDEAALYGDNLISGAVRGDEPAGAFTT